MRFKKHLCFLFMFVIVFNLAGSEKETVAVIEFKNRSEGGVRFNGPDLAAKMSIALKENDRFKTADRKTVAKIVKDADWTNERLGTEAEARLREVPARYALYGYLAKWRTSIDSSSTGTGISQRMRTKETIPGTIVLYHFDLVDLQTGKSVKSFETEGSSGSNNRGPVPMEAQSVALEVASLDEQFEEASKTAIRKAASILSKAE